MIRSFLRGPAASFLLVALLGCGDDKPAPAGARRASHDEAGERGRDHDEHDEHDEHGETRHGERRGGDEHGGHEEESGTVRLTAEQVATAKIAVAVAEKRAVVSTLGVTGELVPPDDGVARIGAKVPGRVTRLAVGVGDRVKRGQVLATVDSPELGRAKADYIAAVTAATVARQTADREQALFERKISSERDWRDAEAAATRARAEKEAAEVRLHTLGLTDGQLARLRADDHFASAITVVAPLEGVVVERAVSLGQMLEPSDSMFVVMDLRTVWILADVYERDLAKIAVGQQVEARVQAWRDRVFTGAVTSIGAVVDRRSRTVKVRVVLPNADGALKPGMFATLALAGAAGEAREGLYVPAAAVQRDGDGAMVFVPLGEHEFQAREIEVGERTAEWVEVRGGLAPGERVVTTGAFLLKSEARRESFGGHQH